ncbi:MAG: tRNA (adenosine(37)-N6)-threonylcarbamoyltransferase complex transferase subunit TsaD [Proteobacteria bacterium]|nr:tRNA (adenosine(37)-N6)-threonylcarbamoyltransferase complex transferase subunit TsaD [Pseudomonadota bacterium]NIS71845.1 tRNA (adenosine(37)-N6)-threonylcarbamoyltransferase complex transferase subunit TsaD [Pseudomonadota bacterium]
MLVLAIESSCDDTAVAVVEDGKRILSNWVSSQIEVHRKYGGVVPELASRRHIETIIPVTRAALEKARASLDDIDGIAVTRGPGLVGSLLVGLSVAKSLAYVKGKPLVGVNHIDGHLSAVFLEREDLTFPFLGLVVSGGHTSLYRVEGVGETQLLGRTRDDAAGEVFDKVAKALGLGYPGGPIIDNLSKRLGSEAIRFPRALLSSKTLDFSFSGLKTAVVNYLKAHPLSRDEEDRLIGIVAGFQEAVVDVLLRKAGQAARQEGLERIVVSGGVASNSYLRERFCEMARNEDRAVFFPSPRLCTDNAAMIGVVGYHYFQKGWTSPLSLNAFANLPTPPIPTDEVLD